MIDGVEGRDDRNDPIRSFEEPHERVQDFGDSANDLWSLFGKQAKIHDESWAKALKEDMDGVLIFVCTRFSRLARGDVTLFPVRFILCCSHSVRHTKDPGFESEPRRPIGPLPESNRSNTRSNIATICPDGRPDLDKLYSPIAFPDLSSIGV